jgi:PAS domain S-box-containing protein
MPPPELRQIKASTTGRADTGCDRNGPTEADVNPQTAPAADDIFRHMIETSADGVCFLDPAGNVQFINRAALAIARIADDVPVEGHDWRAIWPQPFRKAISGAVRVAARCGRYRLELEAPAADGGTNSWDVLITARRDLAGNLEGLTVVARDVTAATVALREAQLRLDEMTRAAARLLDRHGPPAAPAAVPSATGLRVAQAR